MVIIAGYSLYDEGKRDASVEAFRDLVEALDAWRAKAKRSRAGGKPAEMHVRRFNAEDGGPLF